MGLVDGKAAFLVQAQETMEGLFPGELVVAGTSYAVARTADEDGEKDAPGGYEEEVEVRVRLRVALLPERWAKGERVELDGRALRLVSMVLGPGDVAWAMELGRV